MTIRPVLNVNLPGMVRAFDERARARGSEYANFVIAPSVDEPRSGLSAILTALLPITPHAHTWLAEDRWRLLGVAQTRTRPGRQAWDLAYLASVAPQAGQPAPASPDDIVKDLLQYALNAAIFAGAQRVFARVEDERPELEAFGKLGFQRYARESTWMVESAAAALAALNGAGPARRAQNDTVGDAGDADDAGGEGQLLVEEPVAVGAQSSPSERVGHRLMTRLSPPLTRAPIEEISAETQLRRWNRRDGWSLLRLYDACTPRRVQLAEGLTVDDLMYTRAGGGRTWYVPMLEPATAAFVHDEGPLMGGWLRLRQGRGAEPHQLTLLAPPESPEVARALFKFGLRVFAAEDARPVLCLARDYESVTGDVLRLAGFERVNSHALLVRLLGEQVLWKQKALAFDSRLVYGVKGLGTSRSHLNEGGKDTLCQKSSTTISTPSSRRFRHASSRL